MTTSEIVKLINTEESIKLMKKLTRYAGNIHGTNSFWSIQREQLNALINERGPPTLFLTFSYPDT